MICPACDRTVTAKHRYRSGKTRCQNRRTWTKARLWKLMELLERGWDDDRIARALGTTVNSVRNERKRNGIPCRTKTLLNTRSVAQRLGIGCAKTVASWIQHGWLKGRQGPRRGGNRQWLIHPDDLTRFLEDPAHWHRWDPTRIPDPVLRQWATDLRAGVRFLTETEAAERCFVEPKTVYQWIAKGWLPAVRPGVRGNHLVRESDLMLCYALRLLPQRKRRLDRTVTPFWIGDDVYAIAIRMDDVTGRWRGRVWIDDRLVWQDRTGQPSFSRVVKSCRRAARRDVELMVHMGTVTALPLSNERRAA